MNCNVPGCSRARKASKRPEIEPATACNLAAKEQSIDQGCGKFFWRNPGYLIKIDKVLVYHPHLGNLVMEPMAKMSREEFVVALKQRTEAMLGQVADAINNAPDGYIIPGSEEKVRDLFAELRKQAFETGLQMRIDAAEAAFPPSEALPDR